MCARDSSQGALAIPGQVNHPFKKHGIYRSELPTGKNNKNIEVFDVAFEQLMKDTSRHELRVYKGQKL